MKKISYILFGLGFILIIAATFWNIFNNNKKRYSNISWDLVYQKGIFNNDFSLYQPSNYKKINMVNDSYSYVVPDDTLVNNISITRNEYSNGKIEINEYNDVVDKKIIDEIDNQLKKEYESFTNVIVSKTKFNNESLVFYIRIDNGENDYLEKIILFVNIESNYYEIDYNIYNGMFSEQFIEDIISSIKVNKDSNKNNVFDLINKKMILKYDNSKYSIISKNKYHMILNNNNANVELSIFYDDQTSFNEIYDIYHDKLKASYEKTTIANYEIIKYQYTDANQKNYLDHIIRVDNNTLLSIKYEKQYENVLNINDFLNFTYE